MAMIMNTNTLAPRLTVNYNRVVSVLNMQIIRSLKEIATVAGVGFPSFTFFLAGVSFPFLCRCWLPFRYFSRAGVGFPYLDKLAPTTLALQNGKNAVWTTMVPEVVGWRIIDHVATKV